VLLTSATAHTDGQNATFINGFCNRKVANGFLRFLLLRAMLVSVEILAAGDGINYPRKGQTVTVHYTGTL
jgi:hypothetical protein